MKVVPPFLNHLRPPTPPIEHPPPREQRVVIPIWLPLKNLSAEYTASSQILLFAKFGACSEILFFADSGVSAVEMGVGQIGPSMGCDKQTPSPMMSASSSKPDITNSPSQQPLIANRRHWWGWPGMAAIGIASQCIVECYSDTAAYTHIELHPMCYHQVAL